jgi:hypothetical protein
MTSPMKEATGKKSLKSYKDILIKRSPNFHNRVLDLQNINDRMTLQKQLKCANDPIYMTTKNKKTITDNNKNKKMSKK